MTTTVTSIFNTAHPIVQDQLDWENERARAFAFFETCWDSIEELPFNDIGDPHVNDRCMAEALAFCEANNIEPELWGLAYT
jgi:hypothetical protein